jgi:hypothetical protein
VYYEFDYLEADRAFGLARQITPYNLDGMDVYSTVLYVSLYYFLSTSVIPLLSELFNLQVLGEREKVGTKFE